LEDRLTQYHGEQDIKLSLLQCGVQCRCLKRRFGLLHSHACHNNIHPRLHRDGISPLHPRDNVWAVMAVWKIRGKIMWLRLCAVFVYCNRTSS